MAATETDDNQTSGGSFSWSKLSERERKLFMGMVGTLTVLSFFLVFILFNNAIDELEEDTIKYRQMLSDIALYGPLLAEKDEGEVTESHIIAKFGQEVIDNNDLKLTSTVAQHAKAVDINVSSYDESQIPIGGSRSSKEGGPLYMEMQLRVDIREAEFPKLLKFLDRIEKSKEPMVIKRISLRERRKKDGFVRARVTVSTFVKKEKES